MRKASCNCTMCCDMRCEMRMRFALPLSLSGGPDGFPGFFILPEAKNGKNRIEHPLRQDYPGGSNNVYSRQTMSSLIQ